MTKISKIEIVGLSRRSFLVGAGAAGIGVAFGALPKAVFAATAPYQATAWVTIGTDGITTIMSPAAEMGQGSMTSVPMLIAEELDADWRKVRIVQSPDDAKIFGNPIWGNTLTTFGSGSVRGYWDKARLAGAQARKVLLWNASQQWKVPMAELSTEPGQVVHKASGRKVSYAQLAKTAKMPDPLPEVKKEELKPMTSYRIIGKDVHRVDVPNKTNGTAKYGIDTQLPDMLYAAVLHAPVQGEKVESIDDTAAKAVKGVVSIVRIPRAWGIGEGVGIIGETVWSTMKAKKALKVTWTKTAQARGHSTAKALEEHRRIAADRSQAGVEMIKSGDAHAALAGAAKVIAADYTTDYLAHVDMEPMNATALVQGDTVELWVSSQSPTNAARMSAEAAGTTPDKVKVNETLLGGGFGRRSEADEVYEAVQLAKTVPGRPVKLIWSREDDVQNDLFRPLSGQRVEIGLDTAGNIVGWRHRIVSESSLARNNPRAFQASGGKDFAPANGGKMRYATPAYAVEYVRAGRGIATGSWRSIAAGYMKFATEVAVDEVAAIKGIDPVAFRLELLKGEPRAVKVVETAAQMSNWGKKRPNGRALGFAYADAVESYTATVAEVSVNRQNGEIKVHHLWTVVDPGVAVHPKNCIAQTEGCVIWGLATALREQLNIENGEVQETNFHEYKVLRMSDIPPIDVKIISTPNAPSGIGEAGVPTVAPAIANAVAALTGKRLRQLPMLPDRVKEALKA